MLVLGTTANRSGGVVEVVVFTETDAQSTAEEQMYGLAGQKELLGATDLRRQAVEWPDAESAASPYLARPAAATAATCGSGSPSRVLRRWPASLLRTAGASAAAASARATGSGSCDRSKASTSPASGSGSVVTGSRSRMPDDVSPRSRSSDDRVSNPGARTGSSTCHMASHSSHTRHRSPVATTTWSVTHPCSHRGQTTFTGILTPPMLPGRCLRPGHRNRTTLEGGSAADRVPDLAGQVTWALARKIHHTPSAGAI